GIGDDIDRRALLPGVLVGPFAPAQATVDRHRASLGEKLLAVLALSAPHADVEVVGRVLPHSLAVAAPTVTGDAQRAHGGPAAGGAQFRIARQIAGDDHAVDVAASHGSWLLSLNVEARDRVCAWVRRQSRP